MKYGKCKLILCSFLLAAMFTPKVTYGEENSLKGKSIKAPVATIIFDDGDIEDYTIMYPYFKSKGIKGCSALISAETDKYDHFLNMNQIYEMQKYGWDFLSHTVNHLDLTKLSAENIDYELKASKDFYTSKGIDINAVVYPYNNYNDQVINEAKKYYDAGFAYNYSDEVPYNVNINDNKYNIYRVMLEMPLSVNKEIIDAAIKNNGWLVFMGHGHYYRSEVYTDDSIWPGKWGNNAQKTKDTIEYLLAKNVRIITVDEKLKENALTKTGWNQYKNNWYYLKNNYSLATEWNYFNNKWYYFNEDGKMITGWYKINNNWYYFYLSGDMAVSTEIDGYTLDSSGEWIE